jgi:hypothetical protein
MRLAWRAAALAPQVAALAPQVAALAASWWPAIAWAHRDLPQRDLSEPERPGSCRELPGDFAREAEIAPRTLVQALLSKQRQ